MLLLKLATYWVLVAEDEVDLATQVKRIFYLNNISRHTHLRARTGQVGAKHDCPWCLVRELLSGGLETILEKLDVATTTVAALLVRDLVLHDKGLVREVDGALEGSRDGVVRSLGLGNKTLVALDEDILCILDLPLADVAEGLAADWGLLGRLGRCPTV